MADRSRRVIVPGVAATLVLALGGLAAAVAVDRPGATGRQSSALPVRPDAEAVLVPLGMSIADAPRPVLGVDGRTHLVYEITIVNQTPGEVALESVQARAGRRSLGEPLTGDALAGLLRVNSGGGPAIPGGGSALLFMDVRYAGDRPTPAVVTHDVELSLRQSGQPEQHFSFTGVPTRVHRAPAVEVGRPLRGPDWVAGNGCCQPINAHRGATLSIDGTVRVAERFAIDWVQLAPSGRLFEGPVDRLDSYLFYGAPVLSATRGRVVAVRDGLPDQTPGSLPEGQTIQTAGGNHVVVRFGPRRFAFYAHLKPGSLRVEVGDRVRRGQLLGRVGNSGNTDAPHLHFHVMDGPSPLQSNGVPFVHPRFTGTGVISDLEALQSGVVVPVDEERWTGRFVHRMPQDLQVVDFGR